MGRRVWGLTLLLRILPWAALGVSGAAYAQASAETIAEVQVQGLRRVDKAAALAGTKLVKGAHFDATVATHDLRAVWGTGFFKDVKLLRDANAEGVVLIYVVAEKPSIKAVKYAGRDALSEDDIKGVVDVKAYTILNTEVLKRNVDKIKDLYVGKGYYLVEVKYRVEPVQGSEHEVNVVFDIVENAKVMVRQITFLGNKHIPSEDIKNAMQTREGNEISWLTQAGTYKEDFFLTEIFRNPAV
jgi:outer membrane protein insertion porin family